MDVEAVGADTYGHVVEQCQLVSVEQAPSWGESQRDHIWDEVTRLVCREGDTPVGAVQLMERRLYPGAWMLYAPGGPSVSAVQKLPEVAAVVRRYAQGRGAAFLRLGPRYAYDVEVAGLLRESGFQQGTPIFDSGTFRLHLDRSLTDLRAGLKGSWRRHLKNTEVNAGRIAEPLEGLPAFYTIYRSTAKRKHFRPEPLTVYRNRFKQFGDNAHLFLADDDGKPVAGAVVLTRGDRAWLDMAVSLREAWGLRPNQRLYWETITWLQKNGYTVYDLRGAPYQPTESHPKHGVYEFKRGTGGEHVRYMGEYDYVFDSRAYRVWNSLFPVYRRLFRQSRLGYAIGAARDRLDYLSLRSSKRAGDAATGRSRSCVSSCRAVS